MSLDIPDQVRKMVMADGNDSWLDELPGLVDSLAQEWSLAIGSSFAGGHAALAVEVTLADGKVLSSALIDHPTNPRSMWHGARGVSFLNPCISAPGAVQVPAGKTLALRYRAVAFDGPFPAGMLDQMAAAWRAK